MPWGVAATSGPDLNGLGDRAANVQQDMEASGGLREFSTEVRASKRGAKK